VNAKRKKTSKRKEPPKLKHHEGRGGRNRSRPKLKSERKVQSEKGGGGKGRIRIIFATWETRKNEE